MSQLWIQRSGALIFLSWLMCVLVMCASAGAPELSVQDCAELGYIKGAVSCGSCERLEEFGLSTLEVTCRACCAPERNAPAARKYARAVLEVCTCKFPAYPQIQAFVKSDRPAKFTNLQIKYVRGLDPIIKLLDRDGSVRDTVAIEKWNTDSVEEFLNMHLEKEEEDDDRDYLRTNKI